MEQLTAVMRARPELLLAEFRDPAITAFNRLEARPRAHDFMRSLRAEIRDPLWLITRQWQLGELTGEDAGSPIDARLLTRKLTIDRVRVGSGNPQPYDDTIPLEAVVEREAVPDTHALRVQAAQYFLRLHSPALRSKYLLRYMAVPKFRFAQDKKLKEDFGGALDAFTLYQATRANSFDGFEVLKAIRTGTFAADVPVDAVDSAALTKVTDAFATWLDRQYTQPAASAPPVWDPERLTYSLATAAPGAAGQVALVAPRYDEGRLDWYSFEVDADTELAVDDASHVPSQPVLEAISFLPVTASFKGMPNPRFWEMEERQVNFGTIDAQTTDHLLLVLAELGLVYGNDWFVVPYKLPVNTLCEVQSMIVTDVFGDRVLIRAANESAGTDWHRWSLFNVSNKGELSSYNRQFYLPANIGHMLESEPLERVQLVRDEMTNMVWAVEEIVPDQTGRGVNGHEIADRTGVELEPIANSPASIRYVLGTTVPENWIPFLPVQRAAGGQDIAFQRAAMPALATGDQLVKPKGKLITENDGGDWFVNEEEIPFAGTIITRSYQRTRWYDGRTYVWIGRRRETGRGVGSSNLRFDQIEPLDAEGATVLDR